MTTSARSFVLGLCTAAFACTPFAAAQSQGIQLTTGVDGGVDLPVDPLFVPETGITVEAWITYDDATLPTTGQFYWPTIARQNLAANAEVWNFRVNAANNQARNLAFIVRRTTGLETVTYPFAAGEFLQPTHVAATYDGQTLSLYKNGVQVATRTLATVEELVDTGGTTRIGNGDAGAPGNESWNGLIDEFRIWPMARTDAEILSTMDQSLSAVPGGVLTFPLDGFLIETSNGIVGTQFGTLAFANGSATITSPTVGSNSIGVSTTTCSRDIVATVGSVPATGNSAFALWTHGGPRPANSPIGFAVAATATAPGGQPPFSGVTLAFDISSVIAVTTTPPASVLGNTRFALPIPAQPALAGTTLLMQFAYFDGLCGPQGISASSGVVFTVQ